MWFRYHNAKARIKSLAGRVGRWFARLRIMYHKKGKKMTDKNDNSGAPANLGWLADAPLFIDTQEVASFYDAIVRPPGAAKQLTYKVTKGFKAGVGAKLGLEAEADTGAILAKLSSWFPSLKAKISGEGKAVAEMNKDTEEEVLIESIDTPQRQLIQLAVHYLLNYPERLSIVKDIANETDWRKPQFIAQSPRSIVFLDFPSLEQAQGAKFCPTSLIPTAAEFEKSGIKLLYQKLRGEREFPPKYEEPKLANDQREARKEYWNWFAKNFSARQAMIVVEEAAPGEKIRWIDYRVPLNSEGDTVHLHINPRGNEDTGVFAYNLVKRGFKHGLRIVGTVKSEPDVNVLAIYEK